MAKSTPKPKTAPKPKAKPKAKPKSTTKPKSKAPPKAKPSSKRQEQAKEVLDEFLKSKTRGQCVCKLVPGTGRYEWYCLIGRDYVRTGVPCTP